MRRRRQSVPGPRRQRANEADRRAAEKEAKRLHVEARQAEVEELNTSLTSACEEIDRLLEATLEVDDYVDLETLKSAAMHPEFAPGPLGKPIKPPLAPHLRNAPVYAEPEPPKGLAGAFGGKKKHAVAVELAQAAHAEAVRTHEAYVAERTAEHDRALEKHAAAEQDRLAKLVKAQERYQAECEQRESDAQARNDELTKFMNDLAFDVPAAIEEYVSIVLSNSVYPDAFPVEHEHAFDLSTRELTMRVIVPEPSALPTVKEYRYVKAKDEIVAAPLSAKSQKDRYSSAVHETALRTLHEIFEADRAGKVQSIALTVGVDRGRSRDRSARDCAARPGRGRPQHVQPVQSRRRCPRRNFEAPWRRTVEEPIRPSPGRHRPRRAAAEIGDVVQSAAWVAAATRGMGSAGRVEPRSVLARSTGWVAALAARRRRRHRLGEQSNRIRATARPVVRPGTGARRHRYLISGTRRTCTGTTGRNRDAAHASVAGADVKQYT